MEKILKQERSPNAVTKDWHPPHNGISNSRISAYPSGGEDERSDPENLLSNIAANVGLNTPPNGSSQSRNSLYPLGGEDERSYSENFLSNMVANVDLDSHHNRTLQSRNSPYSNGGEDERRDSESVRSIMAADVDSPHDGASVSQSRNSPDHNGGEEERSGPTRNQQRQNRSRFRWINPNYRPRRCLPLPRSHPRLRIVLDLPRRERPTIFRLPTKQFSEAELDEKRCSICLNSAREYKLNRRPVARTSCDHFFCVPCIYNWRKESTQCPVCRQDVLRPEDKGLFLFHVV